MLRLILRDPALRALPLWFAATPLFASVVEGLRTLLAVQAARGGSTNVTVDLLLLGIAVWLPASVYLLVGRTWNRCGPLELALPIPAKRIWLAHLIAVAFSASVLAGVAAATLVVHDRVVRSLPGEIPVPGHGIAGLALPLIGSLLLAVVALQSRTPEQAQIARSSGFLLFTVTGLAGLFGVVAVLAGLPAVWSLLPLLLAAALGWRTYREVPLAFAMVPREAELPGLSRDPAVASESWSAMDRKPPRAGVRGALRLHYGLLRLLTSGELQGMFTVPAGNLIMTLASLPILFLWGLLLAGVFFGEEELWAGYAIFSAYMLLAFLPGPLSRLHLVDPLPVPRATIFALLIAPGIVALFAGYGAGRLGIAERERAISPILYQTEEARSFPSWPTEERALRVPIEYGEIAWDGALPPIESPWGESHEPLSVPLWAGSRARFYSPFSAPPESSAEFVALQLGRAIESIYGRSVSGQEVLERYLEVDAAGGVALRNDGRALADDLAGLAPRHRVELFPVLFAAVVVLYLLGMSVYLRTFRVHISPGVRKGVWIAVLVGLMALHLGQLVAAVADWVEPWIPTALVKLAILHTVETGPVGAAMIWLVCGVLSLAVYVFALGQFRRIEVVPVGCVTTDR